MKKFFLLLVISVLSSESFSRCGYTDEQASLIDKAASYGAAFGYSQTLSAIVVQESFVGSYIVRINPNDGSHGSYGVTHILLDTAMWLESKKNIWYAKDVIAEELIKNDLYAMGLAVKKLDSVHKGNWMQTWSKYNGGSMVYAGKIRDNIKKLKSCGFFQSWG